MDKRRLIEFVLFVLGIIYFTFAAFGAGLDGHTLAFFLDSALVIAFTVQATRVWYNIGR